MVEFLFSMHYLWQSKKDIETFFKTYEQFSTMIVSIVDLDQLEFKNGVHTFVDGSTIRIDDPQILSLYNIDDNNVHELESVYVKSLLKWNDPNNEKLEVVLSAKMVKREFKKRGYNVEKEVQGELCTVFLKFETNVCSCGKYH